MEKSFTRFETETAICFWDAMMNSRFWQTARENIGSYSIREIVIDRLPDLLAAWDKVGKPEYVSLDWEFIPWFITYCIRADGRFTPAGIQAVINMCEASRRK